MKLLATFSAAALALFILGSAIAANAALPLGDPAVQVQKGRAN